MGRQILDITGKKYKMLTAIKLDHMQGARAYWEFECECGNHTVARADAVKFGKIHSCGCFQKLTKGSNLRKHGMSRSVIYDRYLGMIDRCYRVKDKQYKNYGDRGITVCNEWQGEHGFENFYEWAMNNGYSDSLTIDRIDVDGNYEPSNCRFITIKEQARNKRTNVLITIGEETKCVTEWCELFGIPRWVVYQRKRAHPEATTEYLFRPVSFRG